MREGKSFATLLLWALIILAALSYIVAEVRIDSGITAFLPNDKHDSVSHRYAIEQARGGQGSRLLMLELSGSEPATLALASHQLYTFLDNHTDVYLVNNGERKLSAKERDVLFRYRYLFNPDTAGAVLSRDYLEAELKLRLQELSSTLPGLDKKLIPEDPTMAFRKYLQGLPVSNQPQKYQGVWFTHDGSKAVLILYLQEQGYHSDKLDALTSAIKSHLSTSIPDKTIKLEMAGPGVFAYESRRVIEAETQLFSIVATIIVLLIIFLFYRSFSWMLLSALPLLVAIVMATALTHAVYSGVHGITLAFGVILLGIGIDYPIHYFSHSRRVQGAGQGVGRIWKTVLLGMITSSLGFSVMWVSHFEGLRQLGFFSIVGLVSAALCTRWLLPAFPLMERRYVSREKIILMPYRVLVKYRWILLILIVASMAVFIIKGSYDLSINGLRQLSPVPENVYTKDRELRRQLGVSDNNRFLLVVGNSTEEVLQLTEKLTQELSADMLANSSQQVFAASQILPSQATQTRRQQELPDDPRLHESLISVLQGLPFRKTAFDGFLAQVSASRQLPILDYASFRQLTGDGLLGLQMGFLLQEKDKQWYSLVKMSNMENNQALLQWLQDRQYKNVYYLDVGETVDTLVKGFMYDVIEKSIYGLALIVIVLLLALRSVTRMLAVILPVVSAIVFTLVLLMLSGASLSLFHLVSMLLVLGIGIDYGLFMTRPEADDEKSDTLHSLLVCVLSTTMVFMIISFSDILVLHAVGSTVAIGVLASFVFSVFFSLSAYRKSLLS